MKKNKWARTEKLLKMNVMGMIKFAFEEDWSREDFSLYLEIKNARNLELIAKNCKENMKKD